MTLFPSFGKNKPKNPHDLVARALTALQQLSSALRDKELEKASEENTRLLAHLKSTLQGSDDEQGPDRAQVSAAMEAIVSCDILILMVERLLKLGFETRKDVVAIYSCVCKYRSDDDVALGLEYIRTHHSIIDSLFRGYDEPAIALNCGSMLRDCFRDELIVKRVLNSSILQAFFDKVQVSSFEVASDAFASFKLLLMKHSAAVADFLLANYDMFFALYTTLLKSENYVTRRQSLKLLGELLMERNNVRVMVQYVSNVPNLMLVMNLLKDASRTIEFEAFHVFKVFVANPRKPERIKDILISNKEKLLRYLSQFLEEKEAEDEDFKLEKADIMKEIEMLTRDEGASAALNSPSGPSRTLETFTIPSRPLDSDSRPLDSRPLEQLE